MLRGYWYLVVFTIYFFARFIGISSHNLYEKDIPSKFAVSTPPVNDCGCCFWSARVHETVSLLCC